MSYSGFGSIEMLLIRLKTIIKQQRKLSVLVGSGLTVPNLEKGWIGVSSVTEIIKDIRQVFSSNDSEDLYIKNITTGLSRAEQYQNSMQILLSCFGQDELNRVIGNAVLNALSNKKILDGSTQTNLSSLEKNVANWYLQPGIDALGELYVDFKEIFASPILTSNFDPLIEISIKKHGGSHHSIKITNDGKFLNQTADDYHSVVHFHGYWFGSDTLHTTEQLKRERSQLKGDLKRLLNDSVLLIIGYGGWDDVFTNTLLSLISEGNNNFDVLWSFYEDDDKKIEADYSNIFSTMSTSLGQRVNLYKGIDCNILFPSLLQHLNKGSDPIEVKANEYELKPTTDTLEAFPCDAPPNNLLWVGRRQELKQLREQNNKICFITGIGGQGKSGLASHFVKTLDPSYFEIWDWRDCKEQDHKMQTIIISQIERLSKGNYRSHQLSEEKIEDLIHLFFEVLGERKVVFIYDNVDKYIDLEEFKPVAGLEELIKRINAYKHYSTFIFTCRPHVTLPYNNFIEIQLNPLSQDDTVDLFTEYNPPIKKETTIEIAQQAHVLTNGHALWLNMIAAQSIRGEDTVRLFLESYNYNKDQQKNNPSYSLAENTLDVVWKSLNIKQQILLRGLSEMITALKKDELAEIFRSELTLNQFNKCFNVLNSLNLLVTKSTLGKEDLIELHPLVKEYVSYKYRPNERAKFIMLFVNFYNQLILLIKPKLDSDSPLSYFEKYTHKAELQINNKDFKGALVSIHEVSEIMRAAGYTEEYIRVTTILFERIDWFKAVAQEYNYFDDEFSILIRTLSEKAQNNLVEEYLDKYINIIQGKSKAYINYCTLKCYYHWFRQQYYLAIEWGEKGVELSRTISGANLDIEYNLALALRDSRSDDNLSRALNIFLKGESIEEILKGNVDSIHFSSPYFGNIGRCLWYNNRVDDALYFYYKSFSLLLKERETNTVINQGYAGLWIFEALLKKKEKKNALYFLKFCLINWEATAPIKASNVKIEYGSLLNDHKYRKEFEVLSNWNIESYCKKIVMSRLETLDN